MDEIQTTSAVRKKTATTLTTTKKKSTQTRTAANNNENNNDDNKFPERRPDEREVRVGDPVIKFSLCKKTVSDADF